MGHFIYPDKFTYLNTFVMEVAQRCSDNGGPTVLSRKDIRQSILVCTQQINTASTYLVMHHFS